MVLKCYSWGNLKSNCWKACSCSILFLTSATFGICLTLERIKGIKLARSYQEEERLYVGLAYVEGPGKPQECCMVSSETTGRGKQFPWDCLEQAARRGCGSSSLEIFKTHPRTGLCNVLRRPCLSREVGWDGHPVFPSNPSWSCSWSPQLLDAAVLSSSSWSAKQEHAPVKGSND